MIVLGENMIRVGHFVLFQRLEVGRPLPEQEVLKRAPEEGRRRVVPDISIASRVFNVLCGIILSKYRGKPVGGAL